VEGSPKNNCNAATLQRKQKKIKKVGETFENRNQIFVPLQRQNKDKAMRPREEKLPAATAETLRTLRTLRTTSLPHRTAATPPLTRVTAIVTALGATSCMGA
jgi:hypothetical protein